MSIESRIEQSKCLKALSTFGIGGRASYFISIHTIDEMLELTSYIKKRALPFWVVGKGS
ncbi:MAG: UDP-N-acetylenolpyruvoylglucosamine reductase, partial [Chlamydiae bacterium]|nr:UDP-N-acetylenolpyruvoylglucosamine reductase [Chlamydiota bacterium]